MDWDDSTNSLQSAQANTRATQNERPHVVPIPDHQLLRCIGRGSYGEVWLARNMMGVYRAVKIVHRKSFEHQKPFERELSGIRKFEPISRSHEGFVDVLHVGINEEQGYFYYVMELGDDQTSVQIISPENYSPKTLAKEVRLHGRLSSQDSLQLGLALSQALAELHKHGLVHRDVKPSNIIFVNGVPKLADIGLVADVSEARSYVGTEGFIPPEGPGTPQADVYGLGKVLYEVSTGKDRQEFPELPAQLNTFPDPAGFLELNEVILHACKNELRQRYQSAWDMHADLVVLANGKSVKRLKILERRLSQFKRIASVSALVLTVLAGVFYHFYREWRVAVDSRQRQVGASLADGNHAMESGDLMGALPYFADAFRLDGRDSPLETTHRLRLGSVLAQCPKLTQMWFEAGQVSDGCFSPDGKRILIAQHFGKARIYDLQTGELYSRAFGKGQGLRSASYSPDSRFAVTANEDGTAFIWDAASLEEVFPLPHPDRVLSARFSLDGLRVVTACYDGLARVWDARTGQLLLQLDRHAGPVVHADFSPDGRLIVTASQDNTSRIWNATNGIAVGPALEHRKWVMYAAFSPDSQKIITACLDHRARVWEVATGRRIPPDLSHQDGVKSAEFSPDGRLILTASLDRTARLWLAADLQPLISNPILRHGERLTRASFCFDGRRIITTCSDGTVRIWNLAGSSVAPAPVQCSFSSDGSRFLTFTNNELRVWDSASGKSVSPPVSGESVETAELNHNGRFVLNLSLAGTNRNTAQRHFQVWDAATGEAIAPALSVPPPLAGSALSDDGKRLVTFGDSSARTWDVITCTALSPPLRHQETIRSAFFTPDANRVATTSGNTVQLMDAVSGQPCFAPLKLPFPAHHAESSPDGTRLVSSCSDGHFNKCSAQVWNVATGDPVGSPLRHGDGVLRASFSPNGRRVVTASEDFTASLWDAATGHQLVPALQHLEQVRSAAFSSDGRRIVTASSDKTARVWSAETGAPLTPPLRHNSSLVDARFLPGDDRIVTSDLNGNTWTWELPADERPVNDLIDLARLLTGSTTASAGRLTSPSSAALEVLWRRLQAAYPSDFATSSEEIAAWHAFESVDCENQQDWFAAAFHLKRLLSIRPRDQSLLERLARVNEQLSATVRKPVVGVKSPENSRATDWPKR